MIYKSIIFLLFVCVLLFRDKQEAELCCTNMQRLSFKRVFRL